MGLPVKNIWKLQLVIKRTHYNSDASAALAACLFQVQFKMLFTFKDLHGTGPGYLKDHLFSNCISLSPQTKQKRYVAGPDCLHLAGSRRESFSAVVLALWNIIPPKMRLSPSLAAIWSPSEHGCVNSLGSQETGELLRWLHHF